MARGIAAILTAIYVALVLGSIVTVVTQRRRDGAVVRLMTSVASGPDREVAMAAAKVALLDLAHGILPLLPQYLPN